MKLFKDFKLFKGFKLFGGKKEKSKKEMPEKVDVPNNATIKEYLSTATDVSLAHESTLTKQALVKSKHKYVLTTAARVGSIGLTAWGAGMIFDVSSSFFQKYILARGNTDGYLGKILTGTALAATGIIGIVKTKRVYKLNKQKMQELKELNELIEKEVEHRYEMQGEQKETLAGTVKKEGIILDAEPSQKGKIATISGIAFFTSGVWSFVKSQRIIVSKKQKLQELKDYNQSIEADDAHRLNLDEENTQLYDTEDAEVLEETEVVLDESLEIPSEVAPAVSLEVQDTQEDEPELE